MRFLFTLSVLLLCFSCGDPATEKISPEKEAEDKSYKEVMEVHDEVMPLNADLKRTKRYLQKFLDSEKGKALDDAGKEKFLSTMTNLQKAYDGMMDWMHDFKVPKDKGHEAIMKYLQQEKINISEVSKVMKANLKEGTELLKTIQPEN